MKIENCPICNHKCDMIRDTHGAQIVCMNKDCAIRSSIFRPGEEKEGVNRWNKLITWIKMYVREDFDKCVICDKHPEVESIKVVCNCNSYEINKNLGYSLDTCIKDVVEKFNKQLHQIHSCYICENEEMVVISYRDSDYEKFYYVHCNECQMGGPHENSHKEAIESYNDVDGFKTDWED